MEYNNMVIGDFIRELRKAHHMTQMEQAEKLDISFAHCSQLEQGRHEMSVALLFRMMTLFQVDANVILGIKETEEERNVKLFSGIQDKIDGLEPKQREQFLNMDIECSLLMKGNLV